LSISYSYIHQEKDLEPGIVSQYALEYLRHKLVANIHIPLLRQSAVLRRCRSQIPSRLTLDATLRYQDRAGQYTDFDGSVNDYRPYALVDARLSWQQPACEFYLKANNLLGTGYRDYGLVPQPGRWLIAGVTVSL
jgi:iron complex outermembrane receptor protein